MSIAPVNKSVWKLTSKAEEVWKGLNGIVAIYKPTGNHPAQVRNNLLLHLCRDLNEMDIRPPSTYVSIEGETNKHMNVKIRESYADHELIVGPRYQKQDFKIHPAHFLAKDMSGIMLFGINGGTAMAHKLSQTNPTKFYKVKGIFGQATDNYFISGKIVEKTGFKFIKRHHIDKICASMQSSHQKKMFEACGVDIQSQAAYDLAVQGPIRPTINKIPMLYSMKCIDFNSPEFTLEIVCLNEDDTFLKVLVNTLGLQVRSTATCTQMQCYQYGIFNINEALLKRDWDLKSIMSNMHKIRYKLSKHKLLFADDPIYHEYIDNYNYHNYEQ